MKKSVPVIVETPQGCRNKLAFDFELGMLKLTKVLPAGFEFPFNFGSIPGTLAEDGDPLDILLFMDDPVPAGTLIAARPIGVLEAEQSEKGGKTERNDRVVGVAVESGGPTFRTVKDIEPEKRKEYEGFFEAYDAQTGKRFRGLGWFGPSRAWALIRQARKKYRPPAKSGSLPRTYKGFAAAAED
jgi:inorganic pyrophosphatase